ncbi:MAG: response regulator [Euryarchaeota archaeon]|nr:response regulator [Euryarchaeota archaeon]
MRPRILLVEDEPGVREMLSGWLREAGLSPVAVGSVREGMERLSGGLFDLALIDLGLPDGRGTDLVPVARGLGVAPIVLTGAATPEEARRCIGLGAVDLLTKPVESGRLVEAVRGHCSPRGPAEARYSILVVEDDPDVGQAVRDLLEGSGFDVAWARDPEEGLRLCEARAFPVILSDWKMPKMDGLQFLERARVRIQPHPFTILFTGLGSVERAVDTAKRGVDEYLEKPFKPDVLLGLVERGLQRSLWLRLPHGMAPGAAYAVVGGGRQAVDGLLEQMGRVGPPVVSLVWGSASNGGPRWSVDISQSTAGAGLQRDPRGTLQQALPELSRCPRVVLLECWESLRAEHGFDGALRVVQALREVVEAHRCAALVPVERGAFADTEWSRFTSGLRVLDLSGPSGRAEGWRRTQGNLGGDEKALFERAVASGGSVLQSDLVANLGMSKAKVTRVLSRMESRGLLERKREGMGNRVVLK